MGIQLLTARRGGSTDQMTVEFVNRTLCVKADLGFLEGTFTLTSTVATPYVRRWAVVTTNSPSYRTVLSAVTITSAMSFVAEAGAVTMGTPSIVNGVQVTVLRFEITKSETLPAGSETLNIARTGSLLVQTHFVGSGYAFTDNFSQWGTPFTLHAPTTSPRMPSAPAA